MRGARILAIGLLLLIMVSCANRSYQTASMQDSTMNEWLSSKTDAPAINISGIWDGGYAMGGGWGEARLVQTGREVSGSLGLYDRVTGVVSGQDVYLLISSSSTGRIYFTAHLKQAVDGTLQGKAADGAVADGVDAANVIGYPILLKRMNN